MVPNYWYCRWFQYETGWHNNDCSGLEWLNSMFLSFVEHRSCCWARHQSISDHRRLVWVTTKLLKCLAFPQVASCSWQPGTNSPPVSTTSWLSLISTTGQTGPVNHEKWGEGLQHLQAQSWWQGSKYNEEGLAGGNLVASVDLVQVSSPGWDSGEASSL